jgi:hypothetical protein
MKFEENVKAARPARGFDDAQRKRAASGSMTLSYEACIEARQSSHESERERMRARARRNCMTIASLAMA